MRQGRGPAGDAAELAARRESALSQGGPSNAPLLPERIDVLGVGISAITMADALSQIESWIARRDRAYVCVVPAHTIMDCRDDPEVRRVVNGSSLVTPDGMSLVWLLRLRGRRHVERVYGPDLLHAVCERSLPHGWRHFFLGGADGVADGLAERLRGRLPGLRVAGTLSPPFRELSDDEERALERTINAARPDIVWAGLGSPKQELWMAAHRAALEAPVLVGVGAAFDFLSGRKLQAPVWVQRSGLEWLFRLASEPRRLWRRYRRYPSFAALALLQAVAARRRERPERPEGSL